MGKKKHRGLPGGKGVKHKFEDAREEVSSSIAIPMGMFATQPAAASILLKKNEPKNVKGAEQIAGEVGNDWDDCDQPCGSSVCNGVSGDALGSDEEDDGWVDVPATATAMGRK